MSRNYAVFGHKFFAGNAQQLRLENVANKRADYPASKTALLYTGEFKCGKMRSLDEVNTQQHRNAGARENGRSPRKPVDLRHGSGRFPLAKTPGVVVLGIEPCNDGRTYPSSVIFAFQWPDDKRRSPKFCVGLHRACDQAGRPALSLALRGDVALTAPGGVALVAPALSYKREDLVCWQAVTCLVIRETARDGASNTEKQKRGTDQPRPLERNHHGIRPERLKISEKICSNHRNFTNLRKLLVKVNDARELEFSHFLFSYVLRIKTFTRSQHVAKRDIVNQLFRGHETPAYKSAARSQGTTGFYSLQVCGLGCGIPLRQRPMRVIEVNVERRRNEGVGEAGYPEKTRRLTTSSISIPTCENPVTRPGIKPGSPWWEASVLIAQPPWPLQIPEVKPSLFCVCCKMGVHLLVHLLVITFLFAIYVRLYQALGSFYMWLVCPANTVVVGECFYAGLCVIDVVPRDSTDRVVQYGAVHTCNTKFAELPTLTLLELGTKDKIFQRVCGRGGVVVRPLASHPGEPSSIPDEVARMSDDAAGRQVFFTPSSALKTSTSAAAPLQIIQAPRCVAIGLGEGGEEARKFRRRRVFAGTGHEVPYTKGGGGCGPARGGGGLDGGRGRTMEVLVYGVEAETLK
ncbi:hypothetical protein PR048_027107 [Dryococelus australis]|uniref:Uncharacterized protein n=1 Tax=Dryococelus australis TaxID=614101 RepID=A0ABQ9GG77_9NEOP|nr:hypothetical protein PR048_027107 [Dryococelus australis]